MRRPLEGLVVVDLTIWLYGPLAGTLLADLGAEVIKIERPKTGDFTRALPTLQGASLVTPEEKYLGYELFNRNKKSVTIDMRKAEGQAVFHRLIERADAFVTNFQPSTLELFAALPSRLLEKNPRLIYGLGAGLGTKGALADVPSQDTAAMAYSGFMFTSSPDPEVPFYPPGGLGDVLAGTNLAFGVTSALLGRERSGGGKGSVVTTSLLQTLMWTQMVNIGVPLNGDQRLRGAHRSQATSPLMNTYACSDGAWIALGNPYLNDAIWSQIAKTLDAPELLEDARFATEEGRRASIGAILSELDARFAKRPVDEWVQRCRANDVWCSRVHRPDELESDPQITEQGLFSETASGVRHVRSPFTIEGTDIPSGDAPKLGQDTADVLTTLGFSKVEIERLRAANLV